MTKPGPTETRVRAALLRLWDDATGLGPFQFSAEKVRDECNRHGDRVAGIETVRRVGLKMTKGPRVLPATGLSWTTLGDGIEATYRRGVFRVRRREAAKPDPALRKAFADIRAHDEPQSRTSPGNAWVEIHGAVMFCPCGYASDFTDHVRRVFCSRAEATCEGCGTRWGTPSAAECERLDDDGFPEPEEPRVTQRQLDMMRYATDWKLTAIRNYYIAPPDAADHVEWKALVEMGLAGDGEPPDSGEAGMRKGRVFHVTEAGFRMAYGDVRKPRKRGAKR